MRERPILMNGESVRATLEGRKTQMRGAIAQGMEMLEGAALLAVLWVVVALGGGETG